jgi:long-chain acyl-CoA synthetase
MKMTTANDLQHRWWIKNYDPDVRPTLTYPLFPAYEILRITANVEPDRAAIDYYGSQITYWELQFQVIRMANAMLEAGVKKGDRVGILLANCPQFVITFWALLQIGAIVVNLNPMYTKEELKTNVINMGITGLVTFETQVAKVKELCKEVSIPFVVVTRLSDYRNEMEVSTPEELGLENGWYHFSQMIESCTNEAAPEVEINQEDPAIIQLTGGTTGTPKGAVLTHRNVVCSTYAVDELLKPIVHLYPVHKRHIIGVLPYFHIYGEICANCFSVVTRSTQVILTGFDVDEVMNTVMRFEAIPYFPAVPTMITALINHPRIRELAKVVGILNSGGAPLPKELMRKAKSLNIFIAEGFGMSETTCLGINNPYLGLKKPLSIGMPVTDTDVKFVDPESGEEVKLGEPGEIWIKSPLVMKGYWNNPEETAKVFTEDGWLKTGDIAYQDEDGYIFIVDRSKDMIISGGYNVYPREIDEVILKHPKVKDVITIGVPDEYRGEVPKAFVQLEEGVEATAEEIIAYCREQLASYKVPRLIEFRNEVPRSAVGKALRRVLRDEELAKRG